MWLLCIAIICYGICNSIRYSTLIYTELACADDTSEVNQIKAHRDKNGKIIIENDDLWRSDILKYNALLVDKWVKEGKYNLENRQLEAQNKKRAIKHKQIYGW